MRIKFLKPRYDPFMALKQLLFIYIYIEIVVLDSRIAVPCIFKGDMVKSCLGILFDWNEYHSIRIVSFSFCNLWRLHAQLLFLFTRGPEGYQLSNGITLV